MSTGKQSRSLALSKKVRRLVGERRRRIKRERAAGKRELKDVQAGGVEWLEVRKDDD
jgi:hypothetical protein